MSTSQVNGDKLLAYVQRIERLTEERKAIADDISDVYVEVRAEGYDAKIVKKIVRDRAVDRDVRLEAETIYDLYWQVIEEAASRACTHVREAA